MARFRYKNVYFLVSRATNGGPVSGPFTAVRDWREWCLYREWICKRRCGHVCHGGGGDFLVSSLLSLDLVGGVVGVVASIATATAAPVASAAMGAIVAIVVIVVCIMVLVVVVVAAAVPRVRARASRRCRRRSPRCRYLPGLRAIGPFGPEGFFDFRIIRNLGLGHWAFLALGHFESLWA